MGKDGGNDSEKGDQTNDTSLAEPALPLSPRMAFCTMGDRIKLVKSVASTKLLGLLEQGEPLSSSSRDSCKEDAQPISETPLSTCCYRGRGERMWRWVSVLKQAWKVL